MAQIRIKGARQHNLRDLDVRIPRDKLTVVTGVSGSGKSSLAFDTLYAEGYRKYVESLSTHARSLLEQWNRPDVDYIEGLSPVIAIEQHHSSAANPRTTVASTSEIADYARLLWMVLGVQHCPYDGGLIERRSLDDCLNTLFCEKNGTRLMLLAHTATARPSVLREELGRLRLRGFSRVRLNGQIHELDERNAFLPPGNKDAVLDVVVDRIVISPEQRSRMADSLELAFREGHDQAIALVQGEGETQWREIILSQHLACSKCGRTYEPLTSRHFSPNHPEGACPTCGGVGQTLQFKEELIVPDPEKTVRGGAIKPWRLGSMVMHIRRNAMLRQLAEQLPFDPNVPWKDLPEKTRKILMHGAGDRLFQFRFTRSSKAQTMPFEGVLADLAKTRMETTSEGLRARLMAFQVSALCPECKGRRLSARARSVLLDGESLDHFYARDIASAYAFIRGVSDKYASNPSVADAVAGLRERLRFLNEVGLGYLTLDRQVSTLSGGEAQRARLATQLGMGLVGVTYVLDEPSIGLHPIDNEKLLGTLRQLRDRGNTLVVVEHDAETMKAADYLLELGPGAGREGGELLFAGTPQESLSARDSRTGLYLSGRAKVEKTAQTLAPDKGWLRVKGAAEHNLKNVDVDFPLGLLTVVCGVSGSGKSTLVNDVLGAAAARKLNRAKTVPGRHRKIEGLEQFEGCIRVDQEPIGRSPRSNPATFTKIFDLLRTLYAATPLAKVRGYKASRFSFNARGGRCERCQGDGQIRLDMNFLGETYVQCPSCLGKRYNRETLEVCFKGYSIADVLDMSAAEALDVFRSQPRLAQRLQTLVDVGLGYLKLGQSATTLSGGEAQRLKLSLELGKRFAGPTLYLLDEPTSGLHWDDIQKLLDLLFKLRDAGHTIVVIEHQLDLIRNADWVIEMGPGGGEAGGSLVYAGAPSGLALEEDSPTGKCLRGEQTRSL